MLPSIFDSFFRHQQEVLLFPAMKPDDPNKPKEDVPEGSVE